MDSVRSMARSSSSTVPSSERTSHFTSQTETEMESSKSRHWSQLNYSTTDSKWSAESNEYHFALLKEDPQWGRFFKDFEALEVGEKISQGAQADIYAARQRRDGPFDLVVKVMKGDAPLQDFQAQWPIGMLSAHHQQLYSMPTIAILGGTVLRDKRLRGRFAFVMYRRGGDLRLLIDRRMKRERSTHGPFPLDEAIHLMLRIAEDMDLLHNQHDIIHRDLKASNVLVWGDIGEDMSIVAPPNQGKKVESVVADFECSVGVLGTGFWRAPEILRQLKDRDLPRSKVQFTRASDVYSYGMTCYEIVTGCIPYDGLEDMTSQVLEGRHPELPAWVRNIIVCCWHSDPLERPTFSDICRALKLKRGPNPVSVVIDNESQSGASIVKVEQWNNPQPLTLLEVMQKLMDMALSILKASDLSSTETTTLYFEVTDWEGRKVMNDESIANITEALSLPVKMKWISESGGTTINEVAPVRKYVIEVVAEMSAGLLGVVCRLLVATDFRVHSAGCSTREGRLECVIYVEGAGVSTLLWEFRHNMEYFPKSPGRFKITVHSVADEESSHLNRRLHNLKSMDLTLTRSSSNIRVHQRKRSEEGSCSTDVIVCLQDWSSLYQLSNYLRLFAGYKICRASVEYPHRFLWSRANKIEDIYIDDSDTYFHGRTIFRIREVAYERGCHEVNAQLIVSGPSEKLHDDLMGSFLMIDLVVTGGQVYRKYGTGLLFPSGDLEFFVTSASEPPLSSQPF